MRARFRIDSTEPRVSAGERYDAIEYAMDFDCRGGRTRLVSRTTWLQGRRQRSDAQEGLPWRPVRAATDDARGLDAVCRVRGGGPVTALRPATTRSFAAPAAGWVVMTESERARWLLQPASATRREGGGVAVMVLMETGTEQDSPWGKMDAVRFRVEVDCARARSRYLQGTALRRGAVVHAIPIPPQQAAWATSSPDNPLITQVCQVLAPPTP